jgi:hypothetical protein
MTNIDDVKIFLREKYHVMLKGAGVNPLAFSVSPFKLRPTSFTINVEGLKPKAIDRRSQLDFFHSFLANPLNPGCYCVSSDPNDRLAKVVGAFMIQQWYDYKAHHSESLAGSLPMWHDLLGGFHNPLVGDDPTRGRLGFLVLNNVLPTSTNVKLEKLRDILETHADIPRVVVTSGGDPMTLFLKYLHYPLNGCIYLTSSLVKPDVEI